MDTNSSESRPGWGLEDRPPVKQGWTWIGTLLLLALVILVLAYYAVTAGCAAPGARQGTAEFVTTADVEVAVQAILAMVADQSQRVVEATTEAVVAVSKVDQSVGDDWDSRLIAAGVAILVASYGVGKVIWLVLRATGRRVLRKK